MLEACTSMYRLAPPRSRVQQRVHPATGHANRSEERSGSETTASVVLRYGIVFVSRGPGDLVIVPLHNRFGPLKERHDEASLARWNFDIIIANSENGVYIWRAGSKSGQLLLQTAHSNSPNTTIDLSSLHATCRLLPSSPSSSTANMAPTLRK